MARISIYTPEGQADAGAGATALAPAGSLADRRIAVLDNGKAGAAHLLERMAEGLARRSHGEYVGLHRKGSAATPCEAALLTSLASSADLILTGTAD